jgi:ribonuclease HI
MAAIAARVKTTNESDLVWEYATDKKYDPNKVALVWIPGHHRIPGNEEADKLAKEGTNEVPVEQTTGIPLAVGKGVIRSY